MATSIDDLLQRIYPELYLLPDEDKAIYQEIASRFTSEAYFEESYNLAIALRMSHYYAIDSNPANKSGAGGAITNMSEGRTSVSFWNTIPDGDYSTLNLTKYGQRLKALIKSIGPALSGNGMYV
jgi:hypothetical protein